MGKFQEEYNDEDFRREFKTFIRVLLTLILACIICSLFGSCRSQFVDISDDMFIHDTVRIEHTRVDSFIQHDSVYHFECLKADSVIIKDVIYKTIYKPKIEYRDSIVYRDREHQVVKEVRVEKKPSLWAKILMIFAHLLAGVMGGVIIGAISLNLWRWWKGK